MYEAAWAEGRLPAERGMRNTSNDGGMSLMSWRRGSHRAKVDRPETGNG